ncbi:MAG: pyridoxal-phosphate dependent enzyme, partial [Pseudomonadota bacterium]
LKNDYIDRIQAVAGPDAIATARDLARREGIFCGISGGATVAAALAMADDVPAGSKILAMLPDTGERYLSTPLFDDVSVEMSEDEVALSNSTPNVRFVPPAEAA